MFWTLNVVTRDAMSLVVSRTGTRVALWWFREHFVRRQVDSEVRWREYGLQKVLSYTDHYTVAIYGAWIFKCRAFSTLQYSMPCQCLHQRVLSCILFSLETFGWPSKAHDFNPIKNFWSSLACDVYAHNRQNDYITNSLEVLTLAWNEISSDTRHNLIDFSPNRLIYLFEARGGCTQY